MRIIVQRIKIVIVTLTCIIGMLGMSVDVSAASADNSLESLTLSEGTLSPSFVYNQLQYTASVSADTTSINVNAKVANELATIKSISGNDTLKEGSNVITIVVTAENGLDATYTINVTRGSTATNTTDAGDAATDNADTIVDSNTTNSTTTKNTTTDIDTTESDAEHTAATTITSVEGTITLTDIPEDAALSDDFAEAKLVINGETVSSAYQYISGEESDFYMVYATNSEGITGWYQYDASEATYQRYNANLSGVSTDSEEQYQYLQSEYNDLKDTYTKRKTSDNKLIAGLIIAIAVLCILVINLLLRGGRNKYADDDCDEEEKDEVVETKRKPHKNRKKDEEDEDEEVDKLFDDEDSFADFEEEPAALPKRKEKKKKRKKEDIFDDLDDEYYDEEASEEKPGGVDKHRSLDDDLEILDLNDL